MPATNLNIGMDLWNANPAGSGAMKMQPNQAGVSQTVAPSGVMNDQWIQVCPFSIIFVIVYRATNYIT